MLVLMEQNIQLHAGQNHSFQTYAELAKELRISERYLHTLTKNRVIPCYRIGRSVRFRLPEVVDALEAFREESVCRSIS